MKLTIFWPASVIAGRSRATTAAAAAARPTASTTQLTRLSPRSSRRRRSTAFRSRRWSLIVSMFWSFLAGCSGGVGEEAEEAVREDEHEHGEQRCERCVH